MSITLTALQKQRRDTAANWTTANPTLLAGEIGLESDTGYWKVGDGSTAWTSLAYVSGLGAEIPVNRLSDGSARQLLQTAANGTDVEWTSNVDVPGTLDVTGAATFDGNVTVQGDLTVNGTTTTIDTANLAIEDKNIEIGKVATPTDVTADGGGITLKGTTDKTIQWIDSTDAWTSSERFSYPLGSAAAPALTFTGDANTGIYSPGADQVAISTGGSGRLFVDASGNVGISAAPDVRFALGDFTSNEAIRIRQTANGYGTIYFANGSSGANLYQGFIEYGAGTAGDFMRFGTAQNERLRITSTGTVNIVGAGTAGSTQAISFNGSAPVNSLVVDSSGRVGIGTSSPSQALDVVTSIGNTYIRAARNSQSTGQVGLALAGGTSGTDWLLYQPTSTNDFRIFGNSGDRVTVTSGGNVGIGTTSPGSFIGNVNVVVGSAATSTTTAGVTVYSGTATYGGLYFADGTVGDQAYRGYVEYKHDVDALAIGVGGSEAARIDSSRRLLVGTSSARTIEPYGLGSDGQIANIYESVSDTNPGPGLALCSNSTTARMGPYLYLCRSGAASVGSNTLVNSGDNLGTISFAGADGTDVRTRGAAIYCEVDGTPGADDMPGRLVFSTTPDGLSTPTERMRIDNAGTTMIGGGAAENNGSITIYQNNSNGGAQAVWNRTSTTAGTTALNFKNGGTQVGTVVYNNSSTAYNTSSDYRLKENVVAVTDGIGRLQQLKPSRFNFIADPDKTVDGFIAHEVQDIVPEAITGEKDAVDDDGNPIYQGIDQSKLVPLLTAALQEAVAKIESLEARLTAAGI